MCQHSEYYVMILKEFKITYSLKLSTLLLPIHIIDTYLVHTYLFFLPKVIFALHLIFKY